MNDIITIYISGASRGLDYNPMFKFKDMQEFIYRLETNTDVPDKEDTVVEGYRGDNLISVNEQFGMLAQKLRWISEL